VALTDYPTKLFLSALKNDRFSETQYKITVNAYYLGNSRDYDSAYDSNGNKFDFKLITNKPDYCDNSACWYNVNFELNTSREYLHKNQEKDLGVKVTGKTDYYQTFLIPQAYVKAFLSVVKQ